MGNIRQNQNSQGWVKHSKFDVLAICTVILLKIVGLSLVWLMQLTLMVYEWYIYLLEHSSFMLSQAPQSRFVKRPRSYTLRTLWLDLKLEQCLISASAVHRHWRVCDHQRAPSAANIPPSVTRIPMPAIRAARTEPSVTLSSSYWYRASYTEAIKERFSCQQDRNQIRR